MRFADQVGDASNDEVKRAIEDGPTSPASPSKRWKRESFGVYKRSAEVRTRQLTSVRLRW